MKNHILTVTLNPAIDKFMKFEKGTSANGSDSPRDFLSAGGKGINVSRALKRLGVENLATGLAGGRNGSFLLRSLDNERIPNDFLLIQGESRTNLTIIDERHRKVTRALQDGPKVLSTEWRCFKSKFRLLFPRSQYAVFCGSVPPGLPTSVYADLIRIAHKKQVRTVLDTSGPYLRYGIKGRPFMVKFNLEEGQSFFARKLNSLSKFKEALGYFRARGIELVMMTLGRQGALAFHQGEFLFALPPPVSSIHYVGCGDAFLAGYLYAMLQKKRFRDSLTVATAAGAANAMSTQPGFIQSHILLNLIKQVRIKRV